MPDSLTTAEHVEPLDDGDVPPLQELSDSDDHVPDESQQSVGGLSTVRYETVVDIRFY